jgi:hypothetical protein
VVQESTSGYPGPEPTATSLAAATAAIISSHWNGGRRHSPPDFRPVPERASAEYPPNLDPPEHEPYEPEPRPALRPFLASEMQRLNGANAPTSPGPYATPTSPAPTSTGPYAVPTSPGPYAGVAAAGPYTGVAAAGYTPPAPYAVSYEPIMAAREAAAAAAAPPYVPTQREPAMPHAYAPTAAPTAPPAAARPDTDFNFTGSVMSDLEFPEPFVPEPYEPYDPLQPYNEPPRTDPDASLPQRVPAEPDVPEVELPPNDPLRDLAAAEVADRGELSRIATYLREASEQPDHRPEGFDLTAVVEAVRSVPQVRDAQLRWKPGAGHILRIEFVEGADEGQVTRQVAGLLRQTMGLAARPSESTLDPEESTLDRPGRRSGAVASAPVKVRPPEGVPVARPPDVQSGRALPKPDTGSTLRVVLDHVQVTTLGVDATVEVRLAVAANGHGPRRAVGTGQGPAVDAYLLRLAATAAGDAVDQLLVDARGGATGRCFIEHVAVMPFGPCEVAVVVLLLVCGTYAEQLCGSAIVAGDPRQAVVRATLSAVNRRLESLLS